MKFATVMIGLIIFLGMSTWFISMALSDVSNNVNQLAQMVN